MSPVPVPPAEEPEVVGPMSASVVVWSLEVRRSMSGLTMANATRYYTGGDGQASDTSEAATAVAMTGVVEADAEAVVVVIIQ